MEMLLESYAVEENEFTLELHVDAQVVGIRKIPGRATPRIIVYQPSIGDAADYVPRRFRSIKVDHYGSIEMAGATPITEYHLVELYSLDDKSKELWGLFEERRFSIYGATSGRSLEVTESDELLLSSPI